MPDLFQAGISLTAIAGLVALVWWLGLGQPEPFTNEAQALNAAHELDDGFAADSAALDKSGAAAIVAATDGRMMIVKAHGNRWAGRVLGQSARVTMQGHMLVIDSGEKRFGTVTLDLGSNAQAWARRIERL